MFPGRRAFVQGLLFAAAHARIAAAQGFAGLGDEAGAFEQVVQGREFRFPADHGAHPQFRIEWWYVTANLRDDAGTPYGVQWTLFRQSMEAGPDREGWTSRQIWMAHAAATSASEHRFAERLARGGIGQAGVEAAPFHAWIDAWNMRGAEGMSAQSISPLSIKAAANDFNFDLKLEASRPLVLQGEAGYSRKSDKGQASYYYSQPFFTAQGEVELTGKRVRVSGPAWMDREWSSQPLASDQKGWDWLSLHLDSGAKLMLFRLRQTDGGSYVSGNWIEADGRTEILGPHSVILTPGSQSAVDGHILPTQWNIAIPSRALQIKVTALNPRSWMATTIPYWEGPIRIEGSQTGVGYLEMTGY